jgi:hypothetical protein
MDQENFPVFYLYPGKMNFGLRVEGQKYDE